MKKLSPLGLSKEFNDLLDLLENTGESIFITGRAGTGKSTLLQLFRNTTKKRTAVLAPTGIAALNVKGQTIHSFFRLPPKMLHRNDIVKLKNHTLYKKVETIIIDEISMVRADLLDAIDQSLRINRGDSRPFGGVQMIFFGDLFQLPPVIANPVERNYLHTQYGSPYFFSSHVIGEIHKIQFHEMTKVYRQEERSFIQVLDRIRTKTFDYDDLAELNERVSNDEKDSDHDELAIVLTSTNRRAEEINRKEIESIADPTFEYQAKVQGEFKPNVYPTDLNLHLKKGAQVMFIKNDPKKRFVNGSIGRITYLSNDSIRVNIPENGSEELEIEPLEWEISKYELSKDEPKRLTTKVIGTFTQYPIKLAWAITIHKSQGKTFNRIVIDLGRGAFEYGQTYVALSRCKTLQGIELAQKLKPTDIKMDPRIADFYEQMSYSL